MECNTIVKDKTQQKQIKWCICFAYSRAFCSLQFHPKVFRHSTDFKLIQNLESMCDQAKKKILVKLIVPLESHQMVFDSMSLESS